MRMPEKKSPEALVQEYLQEEIELSESQRKKLSRALYDAWDIEADLDMCKRHKRKTSDAKEALVKKDTYIDSLELSIEKRQALFNFILEQLNMLDFWNDLEPGKPYNMDSSKVFQLIFTPSLFMTRLKKKYQLNGNKQSLDTCVVDPRRITDRFLAHFGYETPEDLFTIDEMRWRKEKAIHIFEHAKPIVRAVYQDGRWTSISNHRLLVIKGLDGGAHDGKIINPHYSSEANIDHDKKICQVFDSAYPALRKMNYVEHGNGEEILDLNTVFTEIMNADMYLRNISAKDFEERKKELKVKAIQCIKRAIEPFKKGVEEDDKKTSLRNHNRKKMALLLSIIEDLKDSRGKENPGVVRNRLKSVLDNLEERNRSIESQTPFDALDKVLLTNNILRCESVLELYLNITKMMCRQVHYVEYSDLFKKPKSPPGNQVKYITNMIFSKKAFEKVIKELEALCIRPFNLYAQKISEQLKAVYSGISERDIQKMQDAAIRAYVLCKIFEVQRVVEGVKHQISIHCRQKGKKTEPPVDLNLLTEMVQKIESVLPERELFTEVVIEGYDDAYKKLIRKIVRMAGRLGKYQKEEPTDEERVKIYKRLKKFLKGFDFPAILAELD